MGLVNQTDEPIRCPKCGSSQIFAHKKGYSGKKACCGALLAGPLGLLCGTQAKQDQSNLSQMQIQLVNEIIQHYPGLLLLETFLEIKKERSN